ncbi:EKC/KEOPS complex subunit GON7 [Spathaspora sp. JA1]|nr:EKC/KEOPS complex subunit GON7 [Spathaspora sp. JA1]
MYNRDVANTKRQKLMLIPTATYEAPDISQPKEFHPGDGPHSTSGVTTQISDHVINAGGQDRDIPSKHKDTPMGNLRAQLTTLQDQLNVFLTDRMKLDKDKEKEQDLERKILDEGVDEEDSE